MERGPRRESRIARAWRNAMRDFALAFGGRARDHKSPRQSDAEVDEAAEDSFPASDPPSYTRTRA
jgi:hypothetical protein